jgi:hypothetical protein
VSRADENPRAKHTIYVRAVGYTVTVWLKLVFATVSPKERERKFYYKNAEGRDLSAPERRQTRSFLAYDTEGCFYEAVGPIFTRNDAQGAAGETV